MNNSVKKTYRDEKTKKSFINHLNRINGQINGVKKMIEKDAYCNDVLVQLSAIKNSVKSLSNQVLEKHLNTCIKDGLKKENTDTIKEVIDLFKRFNKD